MVIKVRRIMYLHNLLRRKKCSEDLNVIKSKTKDTFKKHVKQKAREAALETEKLGIYRTDYSKLFQVQGN